MLRITRHEEPVIRLEGVGLATVDRIIRKHGGSVWPKPKRTKGRRSISPSSIRIRKLMAREKPARGVDFSDRGPRAPRNTGYSRHLRMQGRAQVIQHQ